MHSDNARGKGLSPQVGDTIPAVEVASPPEHMSRGGVTEPWGEPEKGRIVMEQPATGQRPIRILHLVKAMDRAGVETWLMNILRSVDRDQFQMDFAVESARPAPYDDEARALGSKVIPCADPRQPWQYATTFRRILREHGPYDIVHSHGRYYNGFVLWLAQREGVPVRIAHSHNDTYTRQAYRGFIRPLYLAATKRWISRYRTIGLACSDKAAVDLFGPHWQDDPACRVLYCGIDLAPFADPCDPSDVRAALEIPADAFVIGHVGRLIPQKNHALLVEIAAEVASREPNMRLLLVGVGALRETIAKQAADLGIAGRIIFAGSRTDVPRLLRGAMDVFLFPSLFEGLGLALVEAQAAGLPCIISDVVPPEADLVRPLIRRLSLGQSASVWADAVLAMRGVPPVPRREALAIVQRSPLNIQSSRHELETLYTSQARPQRRVLENGRGGDAGATSLLVQR